MADFLSRIIAFLGNQRLLVLALTLIVVGFAAGPVSAQELSAAERLQLEAQKAALFQRMLREPSNLDTTFAYADVSARLGDNEAAVSALERMLLFNPNLPRVQLELGALYFRMGSYEIARSYFDLAAAANPPDDVKERIGTYLAEISRLSGPQRFSGFVLAGVQYQSDANLAGSSTIITPFAVVNLLPQFAKRFDFNAFATGSALYSYDLGTQTRDTLEVGGTGFVNHYRLIERLNLGLVEATVGPRFNFIEPAPWLRTASLKPYAIANNITLGGHEYFHTFGVGGEATALLPLDMRFKSVFEFRQKNFENASDRPLSRGFNGSDKLVSLFLIKPVTSEPFSELNLEFDFLDQDTKLAFFTNKAYAGAVGYRIRYDDPTGLFRRPLETQVAVSRSWANYAAPDPCCGAVRFERRWRFGIAETFPITSDVALVLQAQRDIVSSLSLYNYTSNSVLLGTQIRF